MRLSSGEYHTTKLLLTIVSAAIAFDQLVMTRSPEISQSFGRYDLVTRAQQHSFLLHLNFTCIHAHPYYKQNA